MGHALGLLEFDVKESKASIQDDCDSWYDRNKDWGESPCHSSIGKIEYIDRTFNNRAEAEEWIKRNDRTYRLFGVKFLAYPEFVPSAKLNRLNEKRSEASKKYAVLGDELYLTTISSALVTCKTCGSKIAREYHLKKNERWAYHANRCPVCDGDFRPKTNLDRIDKARKDLDAIIEEIKAETLVCEQKQKKKAVVKWLIKLECHC